MIEVGWGRSTRAFRDVFVSLLMPGATAEQLAWWDDLQRITAPPEKATRLWTAFHAIDVREIAPRVQAPTLVCHVKGDAMVPFEQGRFLASLLPDATFLPLEGRNHVLQPDEPGWPVFVEAVRSFLGDAPGAAAEPSDRFGSLTERERAVLDAIARGLSNDEIGASMSIAGKTVRNHVSNIFSKLGVSTRAQAIVAAREAGFGRV